MVFFGERGAQLPLPASAGRLTDVVYHTYSNHPEFVKDGWSNGWSNDKHLGQWKFIDVDVTLWYTSYVWSTYPTLWSTDIWYIPILPRCRCIAMSGRMLVHLVGQILVCLMFKQSNMVEPPSLIICAALKHHFWCLKRLHSFHPKLGSPQAKLLATRIRWKELNGMTTFLQSLDAFFQGWCHGALNFLVGWTKHRKINRGFLNHPLDYNVGPPNDS